MFNYRVHSGTVQLADASVSLNIVGKGDTKLLSGVLYVPKMSYGLISVSRLDSEGYIMIFRRSRVWVVAPGGVLVCSGARRGNLYHLDAKYRQALLGEVGEDSDKHYSALAKRLQSTTMGYDELELLHQR
jgi:hypothetical protein